MTFFVKFPPSRACTGKVWAKLPVHHENAALVMVPRSRSLFCSTVPESLETHHRNVEASAPHVVGSLPVVDESAPPVCKQVHQERLPERIEEPNKHLLET